MPNNPQIITRGQRTTVRQNLIDHKNSMNTPRTPATGIQSGALREGTIFAGGIHVGIMIATTSFSAVHIGVIFPRHLIPSVETPQFSPEPRQVVLKTTPADHSGSHQRLENEASLLKENSHPAYPIFYSAGISKHPETNVPIAFLAMEKLQGKTLFEVSNDREFSLSEAIAIIMMLCSALDPIHKKGLIYRDLSLNNAMLTIFGPKLIDFGSLFDTNKQCDAATQDNVIIGTEDYLAPEHMIRQNKTARADIYSLGIMLYKLITGLNPMRDTTPQKTFFNHLNKPMPGLQHGSLLAKFSWRGHVKHAGEIEQMRIDLDAIIQRATAKKPRHRQQSVLALSTELSRIQTRLAAIKPYERDFKKDYVEKRSSANRMATTKRFFAERF